MERQWDGAEDVTVEEAVVFAEAVEHGLFISEQAILREMVMK